MSRRAGRLAELQVRDLMEVRSPRGEHGSAPSPVARLAEDPDSTTSP